MNVILDVRHHAVHRRHQGQLRGWGVAILHLRRLRPRGQAMMLHGGGGAGVGAVHSLDAATIASSCCCLLLLVRKGDVGVLCRCGSRGRVGFHVLLDFLLVRRGGGGGGGMHCLLECWRVKRRAGRCGSPPLPVFDFKRDMRG